MIKGLCLLCVNGNFERFHRKWTTCEVRVVLFFLLVVVNLLLCVIHKLNFIIGMYVCIGFSTNLGFRHPLGGLRTYALQIEEDYCT